MVYQQNYVGGIIEDKQGFLWIANGNGIARF
ncbi:two-component regulator propeller domain-containing protein, partial [Gelidibacter algens]